MSFQDVLDRHNNCDVVIIPRMWKNQIFPKMGLYCENHCKLIKWLGDWEYENLRSDVEELSMTKEDEHIYHLRLKKHKLIKLDDLGL